MATNTYISPGHRGVLRGLLNRDRLVDAGIVLYDTEWSHEGTDEERDVLRAARRILNLRIKEIEE